ncbi:hypothetical protein L226DRAFT_574758 [Lentinus tigrinus ALCF2SS1-7]|uniref:Uncharacterized protein n=1 Tax=Lentinus tigrinus ALCF2SS1-6 TaxID=1328759 RepID=A0A5C2S300_9APHY|nr:hypothetical protein L227DRAFT_655217 [Lentinus tigrinus ALCF2SS1-6]RPD70435.1 hypothetical protein L226DRAFT_574758 [Lentinus tigrinus ALCF2SS1-7]
MHPDRDVVILPYFDLGNPEDDQCPNATPEFSATKDPDESLLGPVRSVRYAVLHYPADESLRGQLRETPDGALKALRTRQDISCCIVMEAEEIRECGVRSFRPDATAAASALMAHTALAEALEDVPPWISFADYSFRIHLGVVVGLLAGWIDAVPPFVGRTIM